MSARPSTLSIAARKSLAEANSTVEQKFSHGRKRIVVVERKSLADRPPRVHLEPPAQEKPESARKKQPPRAASKRKKGTWQHRQDALKAAKIERTRKAILELRQRRKERAERGRTNPDSAKMERQRAEKLQTAVENGRKREVSNLARDFLKDVLLFDITKAAATRDRLLSFRTGSWNERGQLRHKFVLQVLESLMSGARPSTIATPLGDYFKWPSTAAPLSSQPTPISELDQDIGVLRASGYRVGLKGVDWQLRRMMLKRIYETELSLPLSAHYLAEWGRPKTRTRLQKLANTIATLTRNMKRRNDTAPSIDDWESDLAFLKQSYYIGRYSFRWPTP